MGVLNGFFEMFFEKFSLETLLSSNGRRFIDALWRQAVAEGSEELFTSAANNVADIIVMAEKSGYIKDVADYIEAGSSESEAMQKALLDMGIDMGWDFVGGLISGGIMGGGGKVLTSAKSTIENAEIGKSIMKVDGGVDALMNLANAGIGVSSAQMHSTPTSQIEKGDQNPTDRNVGRSKATTQAATNQANTSINPADVANSLRSKGVYSKEVDGIAEAIVKILNGQELTRLQRSTLNLALNSAAVRDTVSEFINNSKATTEQPSPKQRYQVFSGTAVLPERHEGQNKTGSTWEYGREVEKAAKKDIAKQGKPSYNAEKLKYVGKTNPELERGFEESISKMPTKHRELAEKKITGIEITDSNIGSWYSRKTGKIYISEKAHPDTVIHEYSHALADAVGAYDDPRFKTIMRRGLENLSPADVIYDEESFMHPIYRIECDKFVSKYQGRLYEEVGIYDGKNILLDGMLDYFSEGYEEYIRDPDNLRAHDPDLFDYFEGMI